MTLGDFRLFRILNVISGGDFSTSARSVFPAASFLVRREQCHSPAVTNIDRHFETHYFQHNCIRGKFSA